jgi:hypothetical protein
MRAKIEIIRDRDGTVLDQDVASVNGAASIGEAISRLLVHIEASHPNADLSKLTIKVGGEDELPRSRRHSDERTMPHS